MAGTTRLELATSAVTAQRPEVTGCNFTAPIATFGAPRNPPEFLLHPNCTRISQPRQSDGSRPASRSLVARCSRIRSLRTSSLTGRLVLRSPSVLISANPFLASGRQFSEYPTRSSEIHGPEVVCVENVNQRNVAEKRLTDCNKS